MWIGNTTKASAGGRQDYTQEYGQLQTALRKSG